MATMLCLLSGLATAAVFRVDAASTAPTPNGATWATAYKTIQAGADAASSAGGGEVWVKAGAYTSATSPVLTMKFGVEIYGGFAGEETAREQRDWNANPTTIDGQAARRCVNGSSLAVLDGFVITRGKASGAGGMYNNGTSPTVANCVFNLNATSTTSSYDGGAMYNTGASPTVTNCVFTSNSASYRGGAMYNITSSPLVQGCYFKQNSASYGGGMYNITSSSPKLTNCVFEGNTAANYGGALHIDGSSSSGSSPIITNCTFTGNQASSRGGAIYKAYGVPKVVDCILYWNMSPNGLSIYNYNTPVLAVTYSCVEGGYAGEGNISTDPQFVSPPGNLRLKAASPCIDTGTATGAPATDYQGIVRPQGSGYDMGAYEYVLVAVPNLENLTEAEAGANLAAVGLAKGTVTEEYSDTVAAGLVITQDPSAGQQLAVGSPVAIVLSMGPVPPIVGSIVINSNRTATNSTSVTLALSWSGGGGTGVVKMRFSNDGSTWSAWQAPQSTLAYTLPGTDGYKTVRVQYMDDYNYRSSVFNDYIRLDTVPPTGGIIINNGMTTTTGRFVTLSLNWADVGGSGVTRMRFSDNGSTWTAWESQKATRAYTLPASLGYHTVRVQYTDAASNYSPVYNDYIKVVAP